MSQTFRLSGPARSDIDSIWDYVFENSFSVERADGVLAKIFDAIELLAREPKAGHLREDLTNRPLRFWSVYSYLIAYKPETTPIEIVAIVHGGRDLPKILENR